MHTLSFIKMHGLGNDYVYIDCFPAATAQLLADSDLPALARRVSDRHMGVGSDGLVLIMPSDEADAKMRIFNADGSEAQMCGNAIRCVGKYLYESGICRKLRLFVETLAGIRALNLQVVDGRVEEVTVNMGLPQWNADTFLRGKDPIGFTAVSMGNPHAVFFRDSLPQLPVNTNVEFVQVRNRHELDVRVIERGSGETLACGTGACAAAVAAIWHGLTERKVVVHLPGGDLQIRWEGNEQPVFMTGPATEVFRGEYQWS